jgi:PQQ-dependent catabolism-associated beta-propeller protein
VPAALLAATLLAPAAAGALDTGRLFVSSEQDHGLTVLDARTLARVGFVRTGRRPRHLRLAPDRRHLYVAASDANRVEVVDVGTLAVVDRLDVGPNPEVFDLSPDGRLLYVGNEDDAGLTLYDLAARRAVATVRVGPEPEGVLAHPDGRLVYVASEVASMVHVVDVARRAIVANVLVGGRPRRLALTPDRKELWVTAELGGVVSIVDTATNRVSGEVRFQPRGFRPEDLTPVGIAMTRDGTRAFVGLGRANHVAAISVPDRRILGYALVGRRAWNVTLSRDERTLYVCNGLSDDLSVVDTATLRATRSVPVGRVPYMAVVDD